MPISLEQKLADRTVAVGVIGLGYVGLPLVDAFWQAGLGVIGFDIDPFKIESLSAGRSYIKHFSDRRVGEMVASGRFSATADFARIGEADAVLICVPTPLGPAREPDLSYVERTVEAIAPHLRSGALVILESTTYPGTTREVVVPRLEAQGLAVGGTVFVAYSPEREDPGSAFQTNRIPKVVGGVDPASTALAAALYRLAFETVYPVSDADTAEAVKITENVFRAVNIALANELKTIFTPMGVDIWEVIEAAKTKPFGYMPFYPGPGLGGHCIPIDPFYLSWRAKTFDLDARFVELAGEINRGMPHIVVNALAEALSRREGKAMRGARILVLGVAYKKNVEDIRESPSLKLIDLIEAAGAHADFYDPHCSVIRTSREHARLDGRQGLATLDGGVGGYDAVLIATDHDAVDYGRVAREAKLVIDTRNATGGGPNVVRA
jgi:UDP-N-acetyl-D-glucosamine dehydrogenase